jgi:hypothetical protein
MNIEKLIIDIKEKGIALTSENNQLVIDAPKEILTNDLIKAFALLFLGTKFFG